MAESTSLLKPGEIIKPIIDVAECKILVEALYGLECSSITELNGYDDKNYKVLVNNVNIKNENVKDVCKDGYVLKIMNSLDSKKISFVEAQNSLMLFLCNNDVTCPRPVKNRNGEYYSIERFVSGEHVVRLLEFLPGSILHQIHPPNSLLYQSGIFVASIDRVLKNFHHPAYNSHQTLWMLDSVPQLSQFLFAVKDATRRKIVEDIIQQFKDRVLTVREILEKGIIHGDFNDQNIVVEKLNGEWTIKGILDFGDSQYSCYLFELAIAITYMVIVTKNLDAVGYVIAGYSKIRSIPDIEFSLLKVCVAARLCQSLVMGAYTSLHNPENKYVLTTAATGWELLLKLWPEPEEKVLEKWRTVADSYIQEIS
ncbi:hypothetical protein ILUMI_02092 [Ignelater luminosus]|uniref:Hydroxylysine kinase n=1 Tax=Ignelater luminosus TaxID=2038154 RepID=A0A8K0DPE9_IGNLU|nr:hypothetical protein ILUMI_02092 [Ignelater luminosus]